MKSCPHFLGLEEEDIVLFYLVYCVIELLEADSNFYLPNFLFMQMWSIWFSVTWSGDLHVALWICLWGKMLPPIANWLKEHRSANLSPFSFIQLDPWVPFLPCFIDDSLQLLVEGIFLSWSASLVGAYIYVALDGGQFDSLIWCNWTFF